MDFPILPDSDIPENWLDDLIESLDYTYALNEPTDAEKKRQRERVRERTRRGAAKYRKRHPDKVKVRAANREARKRALPDGLTADEWAFALEYFEHRCAVCGRPVGFWHTLAQDHWIPMASDTTNNPGTVATNLIPLCHGNDGCNNSKHNRNPYEWLVSVYGKRKANQINKRIETYFTIVRERQSAISSL